ncbi:hypothetical protein [Paenibacillus caui]|uniref:hypothetical protein n=1 Tax=Paenibacillus caui TaxID=2873927 RepID=UPI001F3C3E96|nr:hypothetical protein [Paenibacillus caui]
MAYRKNRGGRFAVPVPLFDGRAQPGFGRSPAVPLDIAMGAGEMSRAKVIYRDYEFGNLSYMCVQF